MPSNITFDDNRLASLTRALSQYSSTFRKQLLKIAAAPAVRIRFRLSPTMWRALRAKSTISRTKAGGLIAESEIPVQLFFNHDYAEMIAHELEHVIEQTEGLNLKVLARKARSGVHRSGIGRTAWFETDRALEVGKTVKHEFETSVRACAGTPAPPERNLSVEVFEPQAPRETEIDPHAPVD